MVCTGKVVKATCAASASDYATICKQVSRGHKPDFVRAAECYSEYVRNYAGGKEKTLLLELDAYVKSLAVVRDVPPELFREIAKIKAPHIPLYITALVKATYSCHSHYCKTGKRLTMLWSHVVDLTRMGVSAQAMFQGRLSRSTCVQTC